MKEYHKIQSIFKRDEKTHKFIMGQYSLPEFEYLKDNPWIFTEKIDGTNIRVIWNKELKYPAFGGKTENAQVPTILYAKLTEMFINDKFKTLYPDISMTLYGEGYGAKIQKGGSNYKSNGVDFVLFDVLIDGWWLKREDTEDIANKLQIDIVPIWGIGSLENAVELVATGFPSKWSSPQNNFNAEGLVLRPQIELKTRSGHRIITKLKSKDF